MMPTECSHEIATNQAFREKSLISINNVNVPNNDKMGPWSVNTVLERLIKLMIYTIMFNQVVMPHEFSVASEQRLLNFLFFNYSTKIRPEKTVNVTAFFNLLSIDYMSIQKEKYVTSGWLTVEWSDKRLVWDTNDYEGTHEILVRESEIWLPELIVGNSVNQIKPISGRSLLVKVTSAGDVEWEPPGVYETQCEVDITYYPFDTQECSVLFTTWGQENNVVSLHQTGTSVNLENYRVNGEWEIKGTSVGTNVLIERHERYSILKFTFTLRRRPLFFVMTLIIPVIMTSPLIMVVYLLPVESGEKATYALTVLVFIAVLLVTISSYMPTSSTSLSVLGVFICIMLILSTITAIMSVMLVRMYHRPATYLVPKSTRTILRLLRCVKCRHKSSIECDKSENKTHAVSENKIDASSGNISMNWKCITAEIESFLFYFFLTVSVILTAMLIIVFISAP